MKQDVDATPNPMSRRPQYVQAASWSADIQGGLRASRRTAWIVATVAVAIAALEAMALAFLAPLKTVVPYTILVDRQTGYVETARAVAPGALTQDAAVTQSLLVQYVIARETFDATDLRDNYRKVNLWSDGPARAQYQHEMQKSTPDSPLNLYPATSTVSTVIKSVSLLTPTTALVRFDTVRRDAGAATVEQRPFAAVIAFRYSGAPMKMEDRFSNPLGFQVTRYRRDAETVAPVSAAAPPPLPNAPLPGAPVASAPGAPPISTPAPVAGGPPPPANAPASAGLR